MAQESGRVIWLAYTKGIPIIDSLYIVLINLHGYMNIYNTVKSLVFISTGLEIIDRKYLFLTMATTLIRVTGSVTIKK